MHKMSRSVAILSLCITLPLFCFGLLYLALGVFTLGAGQYGEDSVDHGRFAWLIGAECLLALVVLMNIRTLRRNKNA